MGNEIILKVLDIHFQSEIFSFRDDGFVEDVHKHAEKIYQEFGGDPRSYSLKILFSEGKMPVVSGLTMKNESFKPIKIISFCQHCDSAIKEIFVKGHEETHALQEMEIINLLQGKLVSIGLDINFESYSDKELIADIGGLYSIIRHRFSPILITSFLKEENRAGILELYLKFLNPKDSVE